MSQAIALLRGINVSGKNKIRMADLKALFASLGCNPVATYLQSGNVVFGSSKAISASSIERAIKDQMGLDVPVLTLAPPELAAIFQNNPFLNKDGVDPTHCYVTFLWETPSKTLVSELELPNNETGSFSISGKYVYVHCPNGYGRSKIHNGFFEKKFDQLATTRNWKTVNALLAMSAQSGESGP